MKKVTLTFVAENEVVDKIQNEINWGEFGNVATFLEDKSDDSSCEVEDLDSDDKKWYLIIDGVNEYGFQQRVRLDVNHLCKGLACVLNCEMRYEKI